MPSYRIKPAPAMDDPNIKIVDQPVSRELALYIRSLGEERIKTQGAEMGRVGFNDATRVDLERRNAETQWLLFPWEDERTGVVYEAMEEIVQQVNAVHWQYDLTDYQDMFHFIRYTAPTGHFAWHQDKGDQWRRAQRKLSFTLLLSEPDEYEGGEFEFFDGDPIRVMERKLGDVLVFPSFLQHRVTAVTRGVRCSLVGWASGPRFR